MRIIRRDLTRLLDKYVRSYPPITVPVKYLRSPRHILRWSRGEAGL